MLNKNVTDANRLISLRLVQKVDMKTLIKLLDIRNEDDVRKWMYCDHVIEINEHLQWLHAVKDCDKTLAFVVLNESKEAVGMLKLSNINWLHKTSDWAFYLGESARAGLGPALEFYFINFVFVKLGMQKLNCEVIEGNDKVVKLHKKFLFKEEGFRESNLIKGSKRLGVHLLGLTRENWKTGKDALVDKYKRSLDKVAIDLDWSDDLLNKKQVSTPIDKIESARARNNLNWMSILRLVLEESPREGQRLVEDIRNIDKEISQLTDVLLADDKRASKLNRNR